MRKTNSIIPSLMAVAVTLTLVFAGAAANATDLPTITATQNAYIWDVPPFDGTGNDRDYGNTMIVGEMDVGSIKRLARGVVQFELPELPQGEILQSATLMLYVSNVVNESGLLDDVSIYHSQPWNSTTVPVSLYENTSYVDTGLEPISSSTPINSWVSISVTGWVADDYRLDPPEDLISSFRLQINDLVFIDDGKSHRYSIAGINNSEFAPKLILTTAIPELSMSSLALGVAALGAVLAACLRRKRR